MEGESIAEPAAGHQGYRRPLQGGARGLQVCSNHAMPGAILYRCPVLIYKKLMMIMITKLKVNTDILTVIRSFYLLIVKVY